MVRRKRDKDSRSVKKTTGPAPERLKIDGDWKDSVKKALETPPPKDDGEDDGDAKERDDGDKDAG